MRRETLTLYELAGADPAVRFSPHCWKTRFALAHKGLEAERTPWRFVEKEAIAFSGQGLVPVLVEGEDVVCDSWRIAEHLEAAHPERASLFGSQEGRSLARFANAYADGALVAPIARTILLDIYTHLDPGDRAYFRASREARFGMTLEEAAADRPARIAAVRAALAPLRLLLKAQPFIAGAAPAYADYCVFGPFMWARCISDADLLEKDDPCHAWQERMLDAFDGLGRNAPRAAAA